MSNLVQLCLLNLNPVELATTVEREQVNLWLDKSIKSIRHKTANNNYKIKSVKIAR